MTRRSTALMLTGLFGLAVVVAAVSASAQGDARDPRASTFNRQPSGLRAVYETLRRVERPVARWQRPYAELPEDAGVLVIAAPVRPISEREWQRDLRPWLMEGRTLILATAYGSLIPTGAPGEAAIAESLRYWPERTEPGDYGRAPGPDTFGALLERVEKYRDGLVEVEAVVDAPLTPAGVPPQPEPFAPVYCFADEAAPLYVGPEGPFAWHLPLHAGHIILTATPSWLSNARIGDAYNLALLLRVLDAFAAGRTVLFDERAQGYPVGDVRVGDLLARPAWGAALAQLLILGAWYAGSNGRRFGRVLPLVRDVPRSTLEYVDAMANLYRRAGLQRAALAAQWHSFRVDVARRYGVEPRASIAVLRERLTGAVRDLDAAEFDAALGTVHDQLRRDAHLNDREVVRAARAIDTLRRRVL